MFDYSEKINYQPSDSIHSYLVFRSLFDNMINFPLVIRINLAYNDLHDADSGPLRSVGGSEVSGQFSLGKSFPSYAEWA